MERTMHTEITWQEITLRLVLTLIASGIIGANRGEHGRPAGLRTTELVGLTASASLILANLLLGTVGKAPDSFVIMDVMRLPLGVLTGVGFIGAGAILHKGNLVLGVTTAATLWFSTLMGFCFGAGEIGLGLGLLALGVFVLWGLEWFETCLRQQKRATLTILVSPEGPSSNKIAEAMDSDGYQIALLAIRYSEEGKELQYEVFWSARPRETTPPDYLAELADSPGVKKVSWVPMVKT